MDASRLNILNVLIISKKERSTFLNEVWYWYRECQNTDGGMPASFKRFIENSLLDINPQE